MNIQGGGISFEVEGTNEKLMKVLDQSKKAISTFSRESLTAGSNIDKGFEQAANAIQTAFQKVDAVIDENLQAIKELQAQNEKLTGQYAEAFMKGDDKTASALKAQVQENERIIRARKQIIDQAQPIIQELNEEEKRLQEQRKSFEDNIEKTKSLKAQLRECKEQLALLEANGKRGTEEFKRLQEEAGRLTDAIGDANQQAKLLAHDNAQLQGFMSGISGLAGAFTAAQGAAALFVGENENLQRVMLKVQSLMSVTMGLQQVMNTLNKDSAFMLTTVTKAKELLTAATNKLSVALGISNVAAKALMATLTLGLSVAITAVIALISHMTSEAQKAAEQQKKFNDEVAKAAGKPLSAYIALKTEWENLTGSMKEREKWVQDNADRFEALGLKVYDAKTAEKVLVDYTDDFVAACMAKAKALAAQQLAAEKYEEILKKQAEIEAMPDKTPRPVTTGGSGGPSRTTPYLGENSEKKKAKEELETLKKEADSLIKMQIAFTEEEKATLAKFSNASTKIVAGSVEAVEAEISHLQQQYKRAASDAERAKLATKIKAEQEKLKEMQLKTDNGSSNKTPKDPYLDMLQKRKVAYAKYAKWVQSEDATIRVAAEKEFAELLKGGTSYIDYLEKQRATIEGKAKKTATDLKNLATINNEIAELTKQTVLSDFEAQLNKELQMCSTLGQELALLAKKRDELANDNSDVDNGKKDIINYVEADTRRKIDEETATLLKEYAGYLNEKLEFEENYARKRDLITRRIATATSEKEKAIAEAALAALEKQKEAYTLRSSSERYDQLLEQYKTYQEQQTAIQKKYSEERTEAEKHGNTIMIAEINAREQAELSKLAASRLMASESWNQLFSDLSTLSAKTINKLMADINSQKVTLSAQFNPADLKAINDQLQKAKDELHHRNPFLALRDSLRDLRAAMQAESLLDDKDPFIQSLQKKKEEYQKYTQAINSGDQTLAGAAKQAFADLLQEGGSYIDYLRNRIAALNGQKIKLGVEFTGDDELAKLEATLNKETGATKTFKDSLKDTFSSVGSSIDFVNGAFDSVVGGMKKMGIQMDEETETILNDLGGIMDGASNIASGIATGNPLSVIQGSVGLLSSAFDLFNSRDRDAEKSIKRHQEAVTRLGRAYNQLRHEVDKALGESTYKNQKSMIDNLRAQQRELRGMIEDEKDKKKTDWDRIGEWEEQIAEASREIDNIIEEITKNITQTTAKDLSNQLADALVEAFEAGEDAADAFGEVANDVLKNAVKNALKLQFLEQPLQAAIKQLQKDMGFNEEGVGSFNGLSPAEQARFKDAVSKAGANFAEVMKLYEDLFDELDEKDPSTLSGAIKGASQESIDLLAGQANAVRVNQVTSLDILRNQLARLSNIDNGVNSVIPGKLQKIIDKLTTPADDGLRGQGITD